MRSSHKNFSQTRNTECQVGPSVSGQVEGVKSHLCGRFSNTHGCTTPNSFSWMNETVQILDIGEHSEFGGLDFAVLFKNVRSVIGLFFFSDEILDTGGDFFGDGTEIFTRTEFVLNGFQQNCLISRGFLPLFEEFSHRGSIYGVFESEGVVFVGKGSEVFG